MTNEQFANAYEAYLEQGGRVIVLKAAKPRKAERWLSKRYTIASMGNLKSRLTGISSVDRVKDGTA
jgi:hypothetical protein